jgi:signal transduction protein with GAF and PtsI domain
MSLNEELSGAADVAEAFDLIVKDFAADSGTIHFMQADGLLHLSAATAGMPKAVLDIVRKIPVGKGMAGLAAQRREPITSCNIQTDSSGDVRPGARATAMAGAIVVPILRGDKVVGTLGIANRAERTFSEAERVRLMRVGQILSARAPMV